MTEVFAHRGSRGTHPENTLPAFKEAVQTGCEGIELDVYLTKDGQLVVIHDEKVDRTTNGKGMVGQLTLMEIKSLDAATWFNPIYKEQAVTIPTLQEVMEALTSWEFRGALNIEIKTDKVPYKGIEEKLVKLVQSKAWPFAIVYSSFNPFSLSKVKRLDPSSQVAYLASEVNWMTLPFFLAYHRKAWHISYRLMKKFGQWGKRHKWLSSYLSQAPCRVWTVNEPKKIQRVLTEGVAAIITDYPARALSLRRELKNKGR